MSVKSDALASNFEPQENYVPSPASLPSGESNTSRLSALLRDIEQDAPSTLVTPSVHQLAPRDITGMLRSFLLTDSIGIILGFQLAWTLALAVNYIFYDRSFPNTMSDIGPIARFFIIGGGVLLWFEHTSHYSVRLPFWIEAKKIVSVIGFAMLIDGFLQFATKQDISRVWLMSAWIFAGIGIISLRSLWRQILRNRGDWNLRTIIVGNKQSVKEVRNALASEPTLGYEMCTEINDLPSALQNAGRSWRTLCARNSADYVILALSGTDVASSEQDLAQLMRENVPYSMAPATFKAPVYGLVQQYFFNHDVLLLTQNHGLDNAVPCFIKRTFDIAVSLAALAVLSPFLAVICALVKMDGGPIFFGDKRLGFNGKAFSCLKFRSMVVNGDAVLQKYLADNPQARVEWQQNHKLTSNGGDPRVTAIGRFLRRTSMDELPQLINVLRGEMSIVGPRPIIVGPRPIIGTETEKYGHDISYYCRVRPGITGLWQVSGRADVSYAERVRMDSWYVRNWSVWHDIAIIFKTIPALLKSKGAY